jgi:hypothetical protein
VRPAGPLTLALLTCRRDPKARHTHTPHAVRLSSYRLVRGMKNRYGPSGELGVYEMGPEGLMPVPNPSAAFLAHSATDGHGDGEDGHQHVGGEDGMLDGVAIVSAMEGAWLGLRGVWADRSIPCPPHTNMAFESMLCRLQAPAVRGAEPGGVMPALHVAQGGGGREPPTHTPAAGCAGEAAQVQLHGEGGRCGPPPLASVRCDFES